MLDGLLELARGTMGSAADAGLCEGGEPALDLIDPGSRGRGEMNMKSRTSSKPGADRCGLVGAVVVHDQMDVQIRRNTLLDGVQKAQEFGGPVSRLRLTDDLTGGDIERSEQRRGAMTHVVVGPSLGHARRQRQNRLSAIKRLGACPDFCV